MSSRPNLRPLDFGGVFDQAFKLYSGHWRTLLSISAAVMLPLGILSFLLTLAVFPNLETFLSDPTLATAAPEDVLGTMFGFLGPLMLVGLLNAVGLWLIQGACTHAVSEVYMGREPEWRESLGAAFRRLPAYIGMMILMAFGFLLGFFLFFFGIVWFAIMWTVAVPALIAEQLGPWEALRRSWGLIRGSFWRTFGLTIVAAMIVGIVGIALASPAQVMTFAGQSLTASQATSQLASTLSYVITLPFQALVAVVIYFDQRVRKEAFDLHTLTATLGEPSADTPTQPAAPPIVPIDPAPPIPPPSDRHEEDPFS